MSLENANHIFLQKLKQEIEIWLTEGIIIPDQKEKILKRYQLASEIEQKAGSGKLITTISILGSILVGVGIILFVASNWREIPHAGKLGIIFGAMLAAYITGFYLLYERKNYPKIGASLIFLGTIIFGAGIFLIAQIYNITVHYPNGPLMWGLGILPLAYLLRLKSVLTLTLLALCTWMGMEMTFHIADDYSSIHIQMAVVFFMSGVMLWRVGYAHKGLASMQSISSPYIVIGLLLTLGSMFMLSFNLYGGRFGSPDLMQFYIPVIIMFVIAALVHALTGDKEKGWQIELAVITFLLAYFFLLAAFFPDIGIYKDQPLNRIIFNIVYAAGIIGIIYLGYLNRYPAYINIGLLFFVLDVVARYFDFFWKLLPRSLFFIGGGLILLVGGVILERKRRIVLESFQVKEDAL